VVLNFLKIVTANKSATPDRFKMWSKTQNFIEKAF
jgi:hypothetical protein